MYRCFRSLRVLLVAWMVFWFLFFPLFRPVARLLSLFCPIVIPRDLPGIFICIIPLYPFWVLGKWLLDKIAARRIDHIVRGREWRDAEDCIDYLKELSELADQRRDLFTLDFCLGTKLLEAGRYEEALDCLTPYGNDLNTEKRKYWQLSDDSDTYVNDIHVLQRKGWKKSLRLMALLVDIERNTGLLEDARRHHAFLEECRKHCSQEWLRPYKPYLAWLKRILAYQLGELAPEELEQWIYKKHGRDIRDISRSSPEKALTLAEIQAVTGREWEARDSCKLLLEMQVCASSARALLNLIDNGARGPGLYIHHRLRPQ